MAVRCAAGVTSSTPDVKRPLVLLSPAWRGKTASTHPPAARRLRALFVRTGRLVTPCGDECVRLPRAALCAQWLT